MIRAHQHAAGARQSNAESEELGYSKGGFSTKIHLRCEGNGKPVTFVLTVGQRNESVVFEQLMEQGTVKRSTCGRPQLRPTRVVGDKGYTGQPIRLYLRQRGLGAVIARRDNESRRGTRFDRYRQRNRVERAINRLKQFRRIATWYEKRAENDQLTTGKMNGNIRIWNPDGTSIAALKGHQGNILDQWFSPNGDRLATVGVDGTARIWSLPTTPQRPLQLPSQKIR